MRPLSLVFAALLSLFVLPRSGLAAPPITIETVTSQCIDNAPTITITIQPIPSWGYWKNAQIYYHNPPGASGILWPANTNPATFKVSGAGSFQITNSESASAGPGITRSEVHSYTLATCGSVKKGMTWIHSKSDATTGVITVGCSGCDANKGDTACSEKRPLLCIYKPATPFQLPKGLDISGTNNGWSGALVATTQPVAGEKFDTIAKANDSCEETFGKGWRVAEFHDGGIWNFQAYGGTVSAPTVPSTRFWVYINDQPDGNCWKK